MTVSKKGLGSDLAKVDSFENQPDDYAEIPEVTEADFARGVVEIGGIPVKRGRPAPNGAKQQVTLRLDPDLLKAMRGSGAGWQARVNLTLRCAFLPEGETNADAPAMRKSI